MKTLRIGILHIAIDLGAAGAAFAQDTATFTGTVRDTSGAVVAGAEVTVSNASIGVTRATISNNDGEWVTTALPNGAYDISISAKGFKKYEANGVIIRVGQKLRVDVSLEVGSVSSEVIVAGEDVAQVETQSSEIAGTVTGKEMTQLQLNGRNFTQLINLTPGVNNQIRPGRRHGGHQRQRGVQHQRRARREQQLGSGRRRQHGQRQQQLAERLSQH